MRVRLNWSTEARIPNDIASCLRCRDLLIVRRFAGGHVAYMNPHKHHRILIKQVLERNSQGHQMPHGSYHRFNCLPFILTAKR